jgi:7-keto-8-aminopelargonate synthetase-like enzyme
VTEQQITSRLQPLTNVLKRRHAGGFVKIQQDIAEEHNISAALEARGIFVGAIRPPTVPAGSARLRVTLSAGHSEAQVDELLEALGQVIGAQVIDAQAGGAPGT